jgi:hypothetical protein
MADYKDGDFGFINDYTSRTILSEMYKTITERNLWDYIKSEKDIRSFTNCNVRQKEEILYNLNHSFVNIRSFDWSLEQMKQIADNGWSVFVSNWKNE